MEKKSAVRLFLQTFFGSSEDPRFAFIEQISRFETIGKKQMLFNEGDQGSEFYFLASGRIKPVMDQRFLLDDARKAHARMEAGEHIGKILLEV